ncbi:MAG: cytochrome c oxidase subunit II [Chitinophagales bacterium]|nr:cytochrome c oxidase subunit II [Chitinophagales bacterium]
MQTFFIVAILVLGFLITFQIAKTSEYVSVLRGEEKSRRQSNNINAFLLLAFLIIGLFGVYYCNETLKDKILYVSASVEGENIDTMMWITTALTGFVFIITQIALFWFAFKYRESDKRTAYYFPHHSTLEVIWTVIPAVTLTVMIGFGLYYWFKITGEAPKNAMVVEVTGSQFQWDFRYPGKDKILGKKYYKNINAATNNPLGQVWDDPANHDDIHTTGEVHIVVNKPVKFIIGAKDVIHDVGLVHFRQKMDAVPGTPTTMWFTPKYTTKQMKEITGNPDFVYEISCDQMCGKGHWSMRGVVIVETQEEFDTWMFSQKPQYYVAFPDKDPSNPAFKPDSTSAGSAAVSVGNNQAKTRQ